MPTPQKIEKAVQSISDFETFFQGLLAETLDWPIEQGVEELDDIGYGWASEELDAIGLEKKLLDGQIWQIQPLPRGEMPWGIFLLDFKNPEVFIKGRGMVGLLRRVLRGLVPSRRRSSELPSWDRDNILFICTHEWKRFTFAHFREGVNGSRIPRLASFGWAPETSDRNRTLYEYNLPPLAWPEDPRNSQQWLRTWTSAFDKEKLTKDFFKRFDEVLELVKTDLEEYQDLSSAKAYTQAQLLLERMLFLYFVQNRGWLNQDRKFLINGFEDHKHFSDTFTYYEKFLDVLFWSLSSPPGSSANRMPGIPFLNGGLFDDDDFKPAITRRINPLLKVKNSTFERVFNRLLEAFNFTVTEDTPLDQEVAVDPEMLGKVFESIVLHAETADPEAQAPDKRKATGSYYTPRIVVHFICRETLFQYFASLRGEDGWRDRLKMLLEINAMDGIDADEMNILKDTIQPREAAELLELVKGLTCCDPAVGSGAFPVGLLHELLNFRRVLQAAANGYVDPFRKQGAQWIHETKADIIENCLYGVDIQQQAIEICQLRLWLSLVVDYDIGVDPFEADRRTFIREINNISQLPNLEMNFKRGDSLHDHVSGVPVIIAPGYVKAHQKEVKEIKGLGSKLHRARKAPQRRDLRIKILEKRLDLSERWLNQEIAELQEEDSALAATLFEETVSASERRKRIAHEEAQLREALKKVAEDRQKLERLSKREFDPKFYVELRRLEGADFDSPFNFAWRLDFPTIFTGQDDGARSGFDIIVGNPPFVTARNPTWRELWRQRWSRVAFKEYQLVSPFSNLGFDLLRPEGQLGYIVSNAFSKREFGKPLVEKYFSSLTLQKVVDCSGLLFPGHGTPTCIVFGNPGSPPVNHALRMTGILPGGGDLRTPPEESPLWHTIAVNHDRPGYQDTRICVAERPSREMAKWPWVFDHGSVVLRDMIQNHSNGFALDHLLKPIGRIFATSANDIYLLSSDVARRFNLPPKPLLPLNEGENIRNWSFSEALLTILPYSDEWILKEPDSSTSIGLYLQFFRPTLGARKAFSGKTYEEDGRPWYEYHQLDRDKARKKIIIAYPDVVTHSHFRVFEEKRLFKDHSPVVALQANDRETHHLLVALLNSSAALFLLKQVCFNKGAGKDEERDRFEFAGQKVEQLTIPPEVTEGLRGQANETSKRLAKLAEECWQRGQTLTTLTFKKLFEKPGEAYHGWEVSLPGYVEPHESVAEPFTDEESLRSAFETTVSLREKLRSEMIACQEEMDWLVYAAYGLIPLDSPAIGPDTDPMPIERLQRPFVLWTEAKNDLNAALDLIPFEWPDEQRQLWEARLRLIAEDEHIRRLEQPVYKRRWDEQWKIGNSWACGEAAYAKEFTDAFDHWLMELAEYTAETIGEEAGITLGALTDALWNHPRVAAAWPFCCELQTTVELYKAQQKAKKNEENEPTSVPATKSSRSAFEKYVKALVRAETVPESVPYAQQVREDGKTVWRTIPWEEMKAKKIRFTKAHQKIRGKLNVPRERFTEANDGLLQPFRFKVG